MAKYKIINDPVHGFISIPGESILQLIDHPYFQRLRHIAQMGLSYLVYPGAQHTRFQHALGAMYLMGRALDVLQRKGIPVSDEEKTASMQAILLHDIGHGPFSHALEAVVVPGLHHEALSLAVMRRLNEQTGGALTLALDIFRNRYSRKFFHKLISGQLDTDRLDYLQRDSFYTGVVEGRINAGRIIDMLYVKDDKLCVEEKGIYSVEKFIVSRRFMYWQVYMHKTSFMFEKLLAQALRRAQALFRNGHHIELDDDLAYFFGLQDQHINAPVIDRFTRLTDADILVHLKKWTTSDDYVLSKLASAITYRRPFRIEIAGKPFAPGYIRQIKSRLMQALPSKRDAEEALSYLVLQGTMQNRAYDEQNEPIYIYTKDGRLREFAHMTDHQYIRALSEDTVKYYLIYPREP